MAGFRHIMEALFNPFFLIWLGLVLCVIWLYYYKYQQWVVNTLLILIIAFTIFSTGFFPSYLTRLLEHSYQPVKLINPDIDKVVVLGGGQFNDSELLAHDLLYTASIKRVMEGIRLYRALKQPKLILSGGGYGSTTGYTQASRMLALSQLLNVSENNIILEQDSINTENEAKLLKPLLGEEPFYLVTSAIHMPRAMHLFQHYGMNPIPAPTDFTLWWQDERWQKTWLPTPQNLVFVNIAWHEILGRVWFKIKSW